MDLPGQPGNQQLDCTDRRLGNLAESVGAVAWDKRCVDVHCALLRRSHSNCWQINLGLSELGARYAEALTYTPRQITLSSAWRFSTVTARTARSRAAGRAA